MSNAKPASRVTLFPVSAAVWANETKDGKTYYAVTFERSYKNEKGEWASSSSFSEGDLLLLAKVADLAHSEVVKLRANDKQAQSAGGNE
jgi:hypothetical protein